MSSSIYHSKLAIKITPTSQEPLPEVFTNTITEEYIRQLKQTWEKSSEHQKDIGNFLGDDTATLPLYWTLNGQGATQIDIMTNGAKVRRIPDAFPDETTLGACFFNGNFSQFMELGFMTPQRLYDGIALTHEDSATKENIQKLFDCGVVHPLCVFVVRTDSVSNVELRHIFHTHGYTCSQAKYDETYTIYRLANLDLLLDPESPYGNIDMKYIDNWVGGGMGPTDDQEEEEDTVHVQALEFNCHTMGPEEREYFVQINPHCLNVLFRVATEFINPGTGARGDMIVCWDSEHDEIEFFHDEWLLNVNEKIPYYRLNIFSPIEGLLELENQEDGMRFVKGTSIHHSDGRVFYVTQLRYGDPKDFYSWNVVFQEQFIPLSELRFVVDEPADGTPIVYKQLRGESNDFFKAYYRAGMAEKVYEYYLTSNDFCFPPPQELPEVMLLGEQPTYPRKRHATSVHNNNNNKKRTKK